MGIIVTAGLVDFSPMGVPLVVGDAPDGPAGGDPLALSGLAVMVLVSQLQGGDGSGSEPMVRGLEAIGLGLLEAAQGSASGTAADLLYKYCFPAGMEVRLADGSAKRIEEFVGGEAVWSVLDHQPMAAGRAATVEGVGGQNQESLTPLPPRERGEKSTFLTSQNQSRIVRMAGW
jgi:hypothetical protein